MCIRDRIQATAEMLRTAYDAGVPILCGSESGFSLTPYGHWHARELEVLVEVLGLTPLEAISCATRNGAIALRRPLDSIGVDQPFREGDLVKVEDVFGVVERIGLRSSRIRTLDRTLVSIPNGRLAEQRIESFAERDRLRLAVDIGLTYGTSSEQMRTILARIESSLRGHPKIWPDAVTVAFQGFGDSSLNVLVMAWFLTTDWGEFLAIRQAMLLDFMAIVESEGSSFAFPTRTVHVVPAAAGAAG